GRRTHRRRHAHRRPAGWRGFFGWTGRVAWRPPDCDVLRDGGDASGRPHRDWRYRERGDLVPRLRCAGGRRRVGDRRDRRGGPMTRDRTVPVVTVDGPTASGKGAVSAGVAAALGWHYLDSGALYRLVGLA